MGRWKRKFLYSYDYDEYVTSRTAEWDTGLRVYEKCPYRANGYKILIGYDVYHLCKLLAREFSSYEFLLYADYHILDDDDEKLVIIRNPEIPEQEVSYASVEVEKPLNKPVVIHKHPSGISSFSATDDTYINANNEISILYESGKFVKAVMRKKMPCGIFMVIPCEIIGVYYENGMKEYAQKIFDEQKDRIRVKKFYYYDYRRYPWTDNYPDCSSIYP